MTILKVHYRWWFPSAWSIRLRSSQDQNFPFNFFFHCIHPIKAWCLTGAQSRVNDETSFSSPWKLLHVSTTTLRAHSDSYNQCIALFSFSVWSSLSSSGPNSHAMSNNKKMCLDTPKQNTSEWQPHKKEYVLESYVKHSFLLSSHSFNRI